MFALLSKYNQFVEPLYRKPTSLIILSSLLADEIEVESLFNETHHSKLKKVKKGNPQNHQKDSDLKRLRVLKIKIPL